MAKRPTASSESTSAQPTINSFIQPATKYGHQDTRQQFITDALVMLVAGDLLSLSLVESPRLRELMHRADTRYTVPSRKYLTSKLLQDKSSSIDSDIKSKLKQAQAVCLTIDLWSNRQMRSFIGITGHFILNWTMETVMLACKRFKGKHTAESIYEQYQETVSTFEIASKILTIVTDNASNMIKAFVNLPGFECADISSQESEDGSDTDSDSDSDSKDSNQDIDPSVYEHLPTQRNPCFAHTVQLTVHDGLKQTGPQLSKVIAKAAKIVSFTRKSTKATDILEGEKRLQAANATRWNSQLHMIRSILSVPSEKLDSLDTIHLTHYERNCLSDLCEVLKPFEDATVFVQQENTVSASFVVPCVRGLKHKMNRISSKFNSKLVLALKDSVQRRLSPFEQNEQYILAAVLDPRFKLKWTSSAEERAAIKEKLITHANSISVQSTETEDDSITPPAAKRRRVDPSEDLFDFMVEPTLAVSITQSPAVREATDYLSQPCTDRFSDPLQYWKGQQCNFPRLAQLACRFLCVPASSAPVERLFSIGGKVFRPDRCLLSDTTFELLMFIRSNGI